MVIGPFVATPMQDSFDFRIVSSSSGVWSLLLIMCTDALEQTITISFFITDSCQRDSACENLNLEERIIIILVHTADIVNTFVQFRAANRDTSPQC